MPLTIKQNTASMIPLMVIAFLAMMSILTPTAFADGGVSTGIDTILRSSSLEGDDSVNKTIAGYLNKPIAFIISVTGFLIITMSFLKFVITLLYLAFPDIFDKIDAHQKSAMSSGISRDSSPIDMISYVFALFMPNIKPLTHFAGDNHNMDLTMMDYIKKKFPAVLGYIIVGSMIFDGQARDFMAKAADVGLVFGNIVENHDTVSAVKNFIDTGDRYNFVYDTSKQEGKNEDKIAKTIQKHLHGLNPGLKDPAHADAIGLLSESIAAEVKSSMEEAAKNGQMGGFKDIVSFQVSVDSKATQSTTAAKAKPEPGSGVVLFEIGKSGKADAATITTAMNGSGKKYLTIKYSHLADKHNRNVLFNGRPEDRDPVTTKP